MLWKNKEKVEQVWEDQKGQGSCGRAQGTGERRPRVEQCLQCEDNAETRVAGVEGGRGQEEADGRGDGGQAGRTCRPERALPFNARCEPSQGFARRGEVMGPRF